MTKKCPHCHEPLSTDLFPASLILENLMGISSLPYKNKVVSTVELHVKRCTSCRKGLYHRKCLLFSMQDKTRKLLSISSVQCSSCGKKESRERCLFVLLKCLHNSSMPYELGYIYKILKKYGVDLLSVLKKNNTSNTSVNKIENIVTKCQFKGRENFISSLEFYLHDKNMDSYENDQIITVLCKYLRNTVKDPEKNKVYFWDKLFKKCADDTKIAIYIVKIIECITEEHVKEDELFCKWIVYTFFNNTNRSKSVEFISKYLFSKHYFIFNCLETATAKDREGSRINRFVQSKKLYTAAFLARIVEHGLKEMKKKSFLRERIEDQAWAAAKCYYVIPPEAGTPVRIPLFFYIKKTFKLAKVLQDNNSREITNQYIFYNNLARSLLVNESLKPLAEEIYLLNICMFYNRKYRSVSQQSSFLAFLFKHLSYLFSLNNKSFENLIISLSEKEFNEMIILKALNHNRKELYERFNIPLEEFNMKYAAESLVSNGRNLMYVGLETVPQLCKKHCSSDEYKRFLHDICFATQLPLCTLADEIADDLLVESTNYPVHDTGLLPLIPRFYDSLRCEAWLEKDVLQWCERNNFPELIYTLWNAADKNIKYRFIKRHLKTILQHVLDKTGDIVSTKEQAELIVWCWGNALDGEKESILDVFEALAALPNGYYHANIFFLMHRAEHGTEIARRLMERIISTNNQNGNDA
ncbi:hypothetical protein ENBRE01_3222, partial [Enteropsectra breve]